MLENLIVAGALSMTVASSPNYFLAPRGILTPAYELIIEVDAVAKNFDRENDYIEETYTLKEIADLMIKESRGFTKDEAVGYRMFLKEIFS